MHSAFFPLPFGPKFPSMNHLSATTVLNPSQQNAHRCHPIPRPVCSALLLLFGLSLAVSLFILVAVRNAVLFVSLLVLASLVLAFVCWNICSFRTIRGLLLFVSAFPDSDLRAAKDGQLVKVTGFVSCGNVSLESSYEKVPRCIYTSTVVYVCKGFVSKLVKINSGFCGWSLAYLERFTTDFFITDSKSGMRAFVQAGHHSKVNPLIVESTLVHTTIKNTGMSSYLTKWLRERNLLQESHQIHLQEGYIKEGSSVTVMGLLQKNNGLAVILQPAEPFCTGCLWWRFLLPFDVDGLILKLTDAVAPGVAPNACQDPGH